MTEEVIEWVKKQITMSPAKLEVRYRISYTKALVWIAELERLGIIEKAKNGYKVCEDVS